MKRVEIAPCGTQGDQRDGRATLGPLIRERGKHSLRPAGTERRDNERESQKASALPCRFTRGDSRRDVHVRRWPGLRLPIRKRRGVGHARAPAAGSVRNAREGSRRRAPSRIATAEKTIAIEIMYTTEVAKAMPATPQS